MFWVSLSRTAFRVCVKPSDLCRARLPLCQMLGFSRQPRQFRIVTQTLQPVWFLLEYGCKCNRLKPVLLCGSGSKNVRVRGMRGRIRGGDFQACGHRNFCRRQAGILIAGLISNTQRDFLRANRRGPVCAQLHSHGECIFVHAQGRLRKSKGAHHSARVRCLHKKNSGRKIRRDFCRD